MREIIPPQPAYGDFTSQGVEAHFSDTWNLAGIRGQGVKVGLIDLPFAFNGFRSLMGAELPETVRARCYTEVSVFTGNLADCEDATLGNDHGTSVAETVIDVAPEASLYIATPISHGDLQNTVEWMASQGVSVINYPLTALFDGPGDGTSPYSSSPLRTVDRAVDDGGIVWINAAGNYAESTWFGTYAAREVAGVKFLEFTESSVFNDVYLFAGEQIQVELRWEDSWGGASRDFDLGLWDVAASEIVAAAADPQWGGPGHDPWEFLVYQAPREGRYSVLVNHFRGSVPAWIQMIVLDGRPIGHHTGNGSIRNPAESANPGMLTAGAAPWNDVYTIEPYSGRGPTPDGRIKPDLVGADCGETALAPLDENGIGFCGTSQASAHVAGMAALVRQRFPDYSPIQVADYLKDSTFQFGIGDPNNTWGYGFAALRPAVPPDAPAVSVPIMAGPDWLSVAWEPIGDEFDEPVASYNLRYIRVGVDETVESNWTVVEDVGTPNAQKHILTSLTGGTPYGVQVRGVNFWGEGEWSATTTATTAPPVVPGAPRGVRAAVKADEAKVDLSWTAPISAGGAPITGYKIESSEDGNDPWVEVYTTDR